jgi:hypothetical protein
MNLIAQRETHRVRPFACYPSQLLTPCGFSSDLARQCAETAENLTWIEESQLKCKHHLESAPSILPSLFFSGDTGNL